MAKYAQLVRSDGSVVYVNPELVAEVKETGKNVYVKFTSDYGVTVKGDITDVVSILENNSDANDEAKPGLFD